MHPVLVALTGDREPYPDNDFLGNDFSGENFFDTISKGISSAGAAVTGYGIQTPGGGIAAAAQGLDFSKGTIPGTLPGAAASPGNVTMSIIKNPIVIGGAALVALLLILKKRR